MGVVLSKLRVHLDEDTNETRLKETEDDVMLHQNIVEDETNNITIAYKAQKKVCNKEEVDAEKAKAKLKLETLQDDLYCKGQVEKARLCKVENKKNFGNIKKRHSNAKKKATTILEMALKATALARHDEEDDRGLVAWDAVAKTRSVHARVSNEAALAAVEYLEQTGYIYVKRQAKAILTSNDPDKVCFPASVVIQSTSMLTTLQENMRAAEQRMLEKKTGADCVAKEVEKLAHQERKENRIPCQSFEQLKGDKGVRLWFDPSETSRATREMNKVIVNSNLWLATANRTLFEELPKSQKDAIAIANAQEVAKCKEKALSVANALSKSQKEHDLRDVAFEEGDLCNADIRTAFIEYNAAMRHTKLGRNNRHNSLTNSKTKTNSKLRGGEMTKNNRNKKHDE
jgi:hypothetical protein